MLIYENVFNFRLNIIYVEFTNSFKNTERMDLILNQLQ